jgi:2-polyprenyl-3-methyl-5-hydroxy-6-metoxy-1,4-benzoquinol methylase
MTTRGNGARVPPLPWTGERCVPESMLDVTELRTVTEHLARYWWALDRLHLRGASNQVVLDAPCGAGYGSAILSLSPQVAIVIGSDIDRSAIEYAEDRYGQPGRVLFRTSDLSDLRTKADAVICFEGIEHVDDQTAVSRALCSALKPGGLLLVSTPRADGDATLSPYHTHELALHEMVALFEPYLADYTVHGQILGVGDSPPERARYFVLEGHKLT